MKECPLSPGPSPETRPTREPVVPVGIDLASLPGMRVVLAYPVILQAALLLVFIAFAVLAWGVFTPAGVNPKLFAKSNLVTLVVWGLWWPAMVWGAVLLGRAWCMACPLEFLSGLGERIGRKLGVKARPLPRWIATGGLIVVFYVLLQTLVAVAQLHRTPGYTAVFLVTLLALAIGTALVFQHRAFCRGFCPVGLLLGTYGRGGMLAVRPGPTNGSPAPDARTCPTLLNPSRLDSSRDCLVCCRCIQATSPGTMRLLVRAPFAATDSRPALAPWPVTAFVMVASGFVTAELCTEWAAAQAVFLRVPKAVAGALQAPHALHWLEAMWTLAIVPLGIWLILAGVLRAFGRRERIGDLWRNMALPMALVVAAGHMSKGLAKFMSWAPYLPSAVREPDGKATALAITGKTAAAPASFLSLPTIAMVGLGLLVAAFFLAIREHRLARRDAPADATSMLPYAMVAALFATLVTGWAIQ